MTLRHEHNGLRPAVLPPDEQPFASADAAAPPVTRDGRGRLSGSAAASALARMPRRGAFVPRRIACDPRFEVHNRRRLDWTRKRRQELHEATGGVSHGVGAMINAAAWSYAAGEFAAELAASTGDLEGFKTAATLTATARTHDLGAWELAVREGQARRDAARAGTAARLPPWYVPDDDEPTRPVDASARLPSTPASSNAASASGGRTFNEETGDS